ncbi:TPA: hypothetical protein HA235_00975 [Candidatus Woesearchaeota archaeon]|nr:hypothetical protein [Candidatus Woesearchaeota archaeon]HIH31258.1 hypothetical protein [Candidatus Woesearchaeota archaeon]HIH54859.1 hypothetical protein [Candidatus Woesearchaeota archaeon]HIJ01764.1 hypothetical protein [Candidatus Woesearchaeota archaeon]HIJ13527.1 hypothetical protein [Candidatus Woesearchaeota archaeon]
MTNIQKIVWEYIDRNASIQKMLISGLINTSALARRIAKEQSLVDNITAVISAIRRYESLLDKKENQKDLMKLIRSAKISTRTKLSSILLKRTDTIEERISTIYSKIKIRRDNILRIFEVTNYIKIIVDDELYEHIKKLFSDVNIEKSNRSLSEISINYGSDITKIAGIFAAVANEMAINNISIIDSMICHWEHILIVDERDLQKALATLLTFNA